ncbi:DUF6984 family protein [Larkinella punicea]|uniref:DUF6984 domain-containing protein n=1 Tax=Larkinella punicea TaxID=2315727 RepID=A0A368JHD3_9BACT|nr:hypothetical protein [Larkinella punicea]RCR65963.1 hypothetical protein DUE52_29535 [Larkinella punicea]RYE52624.1 MAG: hypothetical protein EOP48_16100 [Sphingobacteriales bacterium]
MESNRKPSVQEERLLELLVKNAIIDFPLNWKNNLLVRSMEDGKMGSLYLYPNGVYNENRKFDKQVSEYQFKDEDNVEVIASLYVDDNGNLLELDIWKTDFNPLINIPYKLE